MDLMLLRRLMVNHGATRCLFKRLAPNDNSKNQIYLGRDFSSLNILPLAGEVVYVGQSPKGENRFTAALNWWWLSGSGHPQKAPDVQLILYPQYPEVRLSGFLRGAKEAPAKYLNPQMQGRADGRLLFFGISPDGRILGWLEPPGTSLANEIAQAGIVESDGVFCELSLFTKRPDANTKDALLAALAKVHQQGWIASRRLLAAGNFVPCEATNCGGCTLEAELGISANSRAEPDYLGWEVKQHGVTSFENSNPGVLTLMTPEPDGGLYVDHGVEAFIRQFGYADRQGREDRINIGGVHKVGVRQPNTGLTMRLRGYDRPGATVDLQGAVELLDDRGQSAASWSFSNLLTHWNLKHARAVYVPSQARKVPLRQYAYGHSVRLGVGTDFLRLLNAFDEGQVYYDPGIKLENASHPKGRIKKRSQFRIRSAGLQVLYHSFGVERLPGC